MLSADDRDAPTSRDEVDQILADWRTQRPDLDPSPMGIFGRIARVAVQKRAYLTTMLAAYDLTPASFDVLANLRRSDPPHSKTPTELASSSMMSTGGMTFRIDKLEAADLVTRRHSPEDRRVVHVQLTEGGKALIDRVIEQHLERESKMLKSLSTQERDVIAALLSKLEAGMADDIG